MLMATHCGQDLGVYWVVSGVTEFGAAFVSSSGGPRVRNGRQQRVRDPRQQRADALPVAVVRGRLPQRRVLVDRGARRRLADRGRRRPQR